jgi:hypothetical protein
LTVAPAVDSLTKMIRERTPKMRRAIDDVALD